MAYSVDRDAASLVRVRYRNYNDTATCRKYFYRYIECIGRALPLSTKPSLLPFVRGFLMVASDRDLDQELLNSNKSLLTYFYEAVLAAEDAFRRDDTKRIQKIYAELVRQLFSGEYKLAKVEIKF